MTTESDTGPRPRLSALAVLSFVIGLLSLLPLLWIAAGLPAVVIGYIGLRLVNGSEGRVRGRRLAIAGIILGGLGSAFSVSGYVIDRVLESRELANRTDCQNNLRLIGLATAVYHDRKDHYPVGTHVVAGLPPEQRFSWLAEILPDLLTVETRQADESRMKVPERVGQLGDLAGRLNLALAWDAEANRTAVNTTVTEFVCPSAGLSRPLDSPGLTTYVGFAGVGKDAADLPLSDRRAGFFGYDRVLTRKELHQMRGEANTAVAVETASDIGPWAAGGFPTVRGVPPDEPFCIGPGRAFGGIHRTGAYILFADSSVRFFKNEFETVKLDALVLIHIE